MRICVIVVALVVGWAGAKKRDEASRQTLRTIYCKRDGDAEEHPDFEVTAVEVDPCLKDGPWAPKACPLFSGANATIYITFIPKCGLGRNRSNVAEREVSAMRAYVRGVVSGVISEFNLPQPDACEGSGLSCPLVPGQEYTYHATVQILKAYPVKQRVTVNWQLFDLSDGADFDAEKKKTMAEICVNIRTLIVEDN